MYSPIRPRPQPQSTLFPYTTLFRSNFVASVQAEHAETITRPGLSGVATGVDAASRSIENAISANAALTYATDIGDRKSTRLNSSHLVISYAVFCLKKKT